jgi:hypothetical protein
MVGLAHTARNRAGEEEEGTLGSGETQGRYVLPACPAIQPPNDVEFNPKLPIGAGKGGHEQIFE